MARQTRNSVTAARRKVTGNVIATVVIVVIAIVVIGGVLLLNRDNAEPADGGSGDAIPSELRAGPDSNTLTTSSAGKVTVVEFLDYQCPACAGYYTSVTKQLEADYAGKITFVTRNFPLSMHPLAQQAARAAEAAATQGKYQEMYHQLYDNYEQWAVAPDGQNVSDDAKRAATLFDGYATAIGLDLDRFHTDLAAPAIQDRIDTDVAAGKTVGVSSTPTIFVNGKKFTPTGQTFGDVSTELRELIDKALG